MSAIDVARLARPSARRAACLLSAWLYFSIAPLHAAENPAAPDTVCVLDFQRVGAADAADWLQRGLADLMVHALRLGPYHVLERERIRHLLAEHELASSGWIDAEQGAQRARLVKAECVLLGSFALREEQLVIQARLLHIVDQRLLATATWRGSIDDVLLAPLRLAEQIHEQRGTVLAPRALENLAQEFPATVDAAAAHYRGVGAFEAGEYPRALAFHLDAAEADPGFLEAQRAVLRMYALLDQAEHAILYAASAARSARELPRALELYVAAADHCLDRREYLESAIELLEEAVDKARRLEHETGSFAQVRRAFLEELRSVEVPTTPERRRHKSYRLLSRESNWGLSDDAPIEETDTYFDATAQRWTTEPLPYPSVSMWRMRAQRFLARTHARHADIGAALRHYKAVIDDIAFLDAEPGDGRPTPRAALETEAHFMWLRHHSKTGELDRDHVLRDALKLNVVHSGDVFERSFDELAADPRARVAGRRADWGHEYFDFAAPAGFQIDALVLEADVVGLASVSCNVPDPQGWPPRFSLSQRIERLRWSRAGVHRKRIALPAGTEFVSLGVEWGSNPYSDPPRQQPGPARDLLRWSARFDVTRMRRVSPPHPAAEPYMESDSRLIAHVAKRDGWPEARVFRPARTADLPSGDVFTQEWLVWPMNGDMVIGRREDPDLALGLPATICTREVEFDPALVRTHAGGYALFWSRGSDRKSALRFVATTSDLKTWQTPRRLQFEEPAQSVGYTYAGSEPLQRTYNIARIPGGYLMLLGQGFARESTDLCSWGLPRKILPQDLLQNCLVRTEDGALWVVYESFCAELQPYTSQDSLAGYFVSDGKRYRHACEIHVARSTDGRNWEAVGERSFPGQASGLWAFPISAQRIGVGVQFNARFMKWLVSESGGALREVPASLAMMSDTRDAVFFPDAGRFVCMRPVFDYFGEQRQVLLRMSSKELYEAFQGSRP